MKAGPDAPGAFYGRRKGKQLRGGQAERLENVLPRLRVPLDDPLSPFRDRSDIRLEIGFGGGEHLAHCARQNPEAGFIGVEAFVNGVAKLVAVIEEEGLGNVRLFDDDASHLLPRLQDAALSRIDLLYPDPWPKRRQRKRRFVSDGSLAALARVLRPGGEFRFATDIDDYSGWVLARIARSPDFAWTAERPGDWRLPWPDWPGTRYEAKARREGRAPTYLVFRRL